MAATIHKLPANSSVLVVSVAQAIHDGKNHKSYVKSEVGLECRLVDGFQDPNPAPVTSGAPGQYVDTGLDTVKPVQQYSHTRPLVLPDDLLQVR